VYTLNINNPNTGATGFDVEGRNQTIMQAGVSTALTNSGNV